jgi:deoxycytidine triphosphate deaminase
MLPLALLPLLLFTSSPRRMGPGVNASVFADPGLGHVVLITAMNLHSLPESLKKAWRIITAG